MRRGRKSFADLDAADLARIRTLYVEHLWTVDDVAAELCASPNAVATALRSMGEPALAVDDATHVHVWEPAPDLGFRKYRCGCGRTGYRNGKQGIVAQGGSLRRRKRPYDLPADGAVGRTPNLDEYDGEFDR